MVRTAASAGAALVRHAAPVAGDRVLLEHRVFEYIFLVPANRIGFQGNGGPFTLFQLKIIQEVVSLTVFTVFALTFFKTETFRWNHLMAFVCMVMAVYFIFKK